MQPREPSSPISTKHNIPFKNVVILNSIVNFYVLDLKFLFRIAQISRHFRSAVINYCDCTYQRLAIDINSESKPPKPKGEEEERVARLLAQLNQQQEQDESIARNNNDNNNIENINNSRRTRRRRTNNNNNKADSLSTKNLALFIDACAKDQRWLVKGIIRGGLDVNRCVQDVFTLVWCDSVSPLRQACAYGRKEIVRLLLEAGARVDDDISEQGVSCLLTCCNSNKDEETLAEIADMLFEAAKKLGVDPCVLSNGKPKKKKKEQNESNSTNNTSSSSATSAASSTSTSSASLHASNSNSTPLIAATSMCKEKLMRVLLEKGKADPNLCDAQGNSPLSTAQQEFSKTRKERMIELLKEFGAVE